MNKITYDELFNYYNDYRAEHYFNVSFAMREQLMNRSYELFAKVISSHGKCLVKNLSALDESIINDRQAKNLTIKYR